VTATLTATPTRVRIILEVASGVNVVQFDGVVFGEGQTIGDYLPSRFDAQIANGLVASGPTLSAQGSFGVRNLVGQNDGTTPNTKYGISADLVVMRSTSDGSIRIASSVATVTCNLGSVGANGIDTGTQQASTWYHFYFIGAAGQTPACLASATAPMVGPSLPASYTHWGYAGAVYSNGSTFLVRTRMRGSTMYYDGIQNALGGGAATSETAVGLTTLVPPNALTSLLNIRNFSGTTSAGGSWSASTFIRVISGTEYAQYDSVFNGSGAAQQRTIAPGNLTIPNISQNFYYYTNVSIGNTPGVTIDVVGYRIANGGE
jgi:hypothetical protein